MFCSTYIEHFTASTVNYFWNEISSKHWELIGCYVNCLNYYTLRDLKSINRWILVGQSPTTPTRVFLRPRKNLMLKTSPTTWYGSGAVLNHPRSWGLWDKYDIRTHITTLYKSIFYIITQYTVIVYNICNLELIKHLFILYTKVISSSCFRL